MTVSITSRSEVVTFQMCPRKGYLAYQYPNATEHAGIERRKLSLPLATGIYVHRLVEGLFKGEAPEVVIPRVVAAYRDEVASRGLDEEGSKVGDEQAALIEALGWAWVRVRLPKWLAEFEVMDVEREELTPLSDDVSLASRCDAILKRKADGAVFIYNAKTTSEASERWYKGFEVDAQLLTEVLAVERRLNITLAGVLVEGFIKGKRMPEKDSEGKTVGYRQSSPLVYGYKFDGNPPLEPPAYDWEYTRKKGWHRFPTWEEAAFEVGEHAPIEYWVSWLPEEAVEQQFAIVPPIMRSSKRIEAKVRQVVALTRQNTTALQLITIAKAEEREALIDAFYPMNERSCIFPSQCPFYPVCHEPIGEPLESGLYVPRIPNHPTIDNEA